MNFRYSADYVQACHASGSKYAPHMRNGACLLAVGQACRHLSSILSSNRVWLKCRCPLSYTCMAVYLLGSHWGGTILVALWGISGDWRAGWFALWFSNTSKRRGMACLIWKTGHCGLTHCLWWVAENCQGKTFFVLSEETIGWDFSFV